MMRADGCTDMLDAARRGDHAAYEDAVIRPYERAIYSFCYRMMSGDADEAADATQDVFVKAFRAIGQTRDDLNVSAWLHRIATNRCLDTLRRRQRLRWLPWEGPKHDHLLLGTVAETPHAAAERSFTAETVQRALDALPTIHRTVLILREYEGLSCEEIGEIVGCSRSAVKSRLFRAREDFRRVYERLFGHPSGNPPATMA